MRISDWSSDVCSSDLIVGDARTVLRQLGESLDGRIDPKRYEGWRTRLAEINREKQSAQEARLSNEQVPIDPLRLSKEVRDFMDRDAIQIGNAPCRERVLQYV